MKNITLNLKKYSTKIKLLEYLSSQIEELYSLNYDALIDALTFIKEPLTLTIINSSYFCDLEHLLEVLNIIEKENKNIILRK